MSNIIKHDTNGVKGNLGKGEFGFDDYALGGDQGRVWIGTGSENKAIAFKDEIVEETITSLSINSNILSYVAEDGSTTDIDLSIYLDDSNLARLTSGTFDAGTGIVTFERDDGTTFSLDLSALFDDTKVIVNDTLTSTSVDEALSAKQGKVLDDKITALTVSLTTITEW